MRRYSAGCGSLDLVASAPQPEVDYGLFHTDDCGLEPAIGLETRGGDLKFSPLDFGSLPEWEKTEPVAGARSWQEDDLLCALLILQCLASGPENFAHAMEYLGFRDRGVSVGCRKIGFHRLYELPFAHRGAPATLRLFADTAQMSLKECHALLSDGSIVSLPAGHQGLALAVCRIYGLATGAAMPECLDLSDHAEISEAAGGGCDLRTFPPLASELADRAQAARLVLARTDSHDVIRRYARAKLVIARGQAAKMRLDLNLARTMAALMVAALILVWVFLK